ncbi:Kelch repeat-containing protein [Plantactinospora sp. CA-294935]|uniref:Kelch repeat-containing protein n=1 Tax=Plantactinospora sp. CA-294935 TaxID=3240012 RepID=UPI003D8EC65D
MIKRQVHVAVGASVALSLAVLAGVARAGSEDAAPARQAAVEGGHAAHLAAAAPTVGPTVTPVYGRGWRALAPLAGGPRQEHSVVAIGADVYVVGGIKPDGAGGLVTVTDVEVYDTRRDRWRRSAPLPVAMNHPNAAVVGGKLYVLGGLSGGASWEALGNSFVFDPATNRWSSLPPMPADVLRGSAAIGVSGSKIYLAAGMRTLTPGPGGLQDTVATVNSYDVVTRRWARLPDLPEARDHAGGAVVGTTLFVVGGRDRGQVNVRDTVFALDLRGGSWNARASMPTARGGIATAVIGTTIYTFGGEGNVVDGVNTVFPQTEAYDARRDRWQRLAPMPIPRHGGAAVAVGDSIYLPGGGNRGGGAPMDVNDAFRPGHR